MADSSIFTAWLQAHESGNGELEALLEKRFSPDYASAFAAWLDTAPFTDPSAPPGPGYMPEFENPLTAKAATLNAQASVYFADGTEARETANKYVRQTVLFATVLFLIAIAQRFRLRGVRIGANALALAVLAFAVYGLASLPRI